VKSRFRGKKLKTGQLRENKSERKMSHYVEFDSPVFGTKMIAHDGYLYNTEVAWDNITYLQCWQREICRARGQLQHGYIMMIEPKHTCGFATANFYMNEGGNIIILNKKTFINYFIQRVFTLQ